MPLSTDAVITLVILTAAIVLFLTNWIRADVVALLVLISLGVTGVLTVEEAFSGFSRSAVVTIVAIYVLAAGLNLTGAGERVGNWLGRAAGESEGRLVVLVMVGGAFLSLFMNNIAAAAVLLPGVSSAARHRNVNPARLLMPLAFATILGGMATLFTSTNIVSSGLLAEAGLDGFSVLSFAPVGIPVVIVGVLYMAVVGRRILHERPTPEQFDSRHWRKTWPRFTGSTSVSSAPASRRVLIWTTARWRKARCANCTTSASWPLSAMAGSSSPRRPIPSCTPATS